MPTGIGNEAQITDNESKLVLALVFSFLAGDSLSEILDGVLKAFFESHLRFPSLC